MLIKYNSFILNENVADAKTFLNKLGKPNDGENQKKFNGIQISDRHPDFLAIKDMLVRNPGWTYLFTRFRFVEDIPISELKSMYEKLLEYKDLLTQMPKVEEFYKNNTTSSRDWIRPYLAPTKKEKAFEELGDDIEQMSTYRNYKRLFHELTPDLKKEVVAAGKRTVTKLTALADDFYKLKDDNGNGADNLRKFFLTKLSRYHDVESLCLALDKFIKGTSGRDAVGFINRIEDTNKSLAKTKRTDILIAPGKYYDYNVVVTDIKSLESNRSLHSNTSHCIANNEYHWNSYVGGDDLYNKQYYIDNFELSQSDLWSVVGFTINKDGGLRAAHIKNDNSVDLKELKKYVAKWGITWDLFRPMNTNEINLKKKMVKLNNELKSLPAEKLDLTEEKIREYVDEGADVNIGCAKLLQYAIRLKNIPLIDFLIDNGASLEIGSKRPIRVAIKQGDMSIIKHLVVKGASKLYLMRYFAKFNILTGVQFLIDSGVDIDDSDGITLKWASQYGNVDIVKILIDNGIKNGVDESLDYAHLFINSGDNYKEVYNMLKTYKETLK